MVFDQRSLFMNDLSELHKVATSGYFWFYHHLIFFILTMTLRKNPDHWSFVYFWSSLTRIQQAPWAQQPCLCSFTTVALQNKVGLMGGTPYLFPGWNLVWHTLQWKAYLFAQQRCLLGRHPHWFLLSSDFSVTTLFPKVGNWQQHTLFLILVLVLCWGRGWEVGRQSIEWSFVGIFSGLFLCGWRVIPIAEIPWGFHCGCGPLSWLSTLGVRLLLAKFKRTEIYNSYLRLAPELCSSTCFLNAF